MNELYGDWQRIAAPSRVCHSVKGLRSEVLWTNYPVEEVTQLSWTTQQESLLVGHVMPIAKCGIGCG